MYKQFNDVKITTSSVKKRLKKFDLHERVVARKPLLRLINKTKRLNWSKTLAHLSIAQW